MEIVTQKMFLKITPPYSLQHSQSPQLCPSHSFTYKNPPPLHTFFKSSSTSFVLTFQGALQYMYVVHLLTKKIVIIVKGIQRCEIF